MTEEATIRRGVRNARYTTLPNHVLEDTRLSMEARWLLGYLLSKPDNWTVRMADIARKGGCGRDKARRMVAELVEHRYAEKEQPRGEEGKFGRLAIVVYDEPSGGNDDGERLTPQGVDETVASLPQTENPSTDEPSTANAALVKTEGLARTDYSQERECAGAREESSAGKAVAPDDPKKFEQRVKRIAETHRWPRWAKSSTSWAVRQFAELSDEERRQAEERAGDYIAATGGEALSLGVYFADRKWRDVPEAKAAAAAAIDVPPFGSVFAAKRALRLSEPHGPLPKAPPFLQRLIDAGGQDGERERLAHQARHGWPAVNRMHEAAATGRAGVAEAKYAALADLTETVVVGSPLWAEWEAFHATRGWPWLPDPGKLQYVQFPAGGPGGFDAFIAAATARLRGNHADEGARHAAE